jgi:uncharacterized membrane protein
MFFSVIWNFGSPGHLMPDIVQGFETHLQDHFEPILFAYAPLAWSLRSPLLLMIANALIASSGVILLWFLTARRELPQLVRLLLCTMLLTNFYFQDCLASWFYTAPIAIPLGLALLACLQRRRYGLLACAASLLLLVKEESGLLLMAIGISCLVFPSKRRAGLLLILGGSLAFVLSVWIMGFHPGPLTYRRWPMFGWAGPSEALQAFGRHPFLVLRRWAWPPSQFHPLAKFLLSTGLFGLFSPGLLGIIFLNFPHQLASASAGPYHELLSHYSGFMIPLLFWSTILGVSWSWKRWPCHRHVIVAMLLAAVANGLWTSSDYVIFNKVSGQRLNAAWSRILSLPAEDAVWTQEAFAPALAFRQKLHIFDEDSFSHPVFVPDDILMDANYILSFSDPLLVNLKKQLKENGFVLAANEGGVMFWRRQPLPNENEPVHRAPHP